MQNAAAKTQDKNSSQKPDDTRARLINAAIDLFSSRGFESTTTRALCDLAGANLAAIPYHFGSKEKLYSEAADAVIVGLHDRMDGFLNKVQAEIDAGISSRHQACALVEWLMEDFTTVVLSDAESERLIDFILREKMDPSPSFAKLYNDSPIHHMRNIMAGLLAHISGQDADTPALRLTSFQLLGLIYCFRAAQDSALRDLGWKAYGEAEIAAIRKCVIENTRQILKGF